MVFSLMSFADEAAQVVAMLNVSERLRQAYRMKNEFHKFMECKS